TVMAAVVYLLLNSAYLEFYGSLGTRPEDVGLDRLAVLGRASGVLLFLLIVASFLALIVLGGVLLLGRWRPTLLPVSRAAVEALFPAIWLIFRKRLFVLTGIIAGVLVTFAAVVATVAVGTRAERAEDGLTVNPVAVGPFVFVDVKADAAQAVWVDKDAPMPALLNDPWLLYLGQNNQVAVFMACGRTVILPVGKVVPIILTTKADRDRARGEAAARETECGRLRAVSG
ncbi:MAG TPA: hypothetical protein VFT95_21560, partial [Micromonosporaceae bacterium]|nr:hypothetical protein [Micromonosporaceae bacterium]